jgi:Mechanosensitive ion channel, conserved TM helix
MFLADIGDTVDRGFEVFFAWVPALLGAIAILIIGYIVARVLGGLVGRVLQRVGLDRTLHSGTAGNWVAKVTSSPSRLLGSLTFWVVFLGAISLAVTALGIDALTDFVGEIYAYLPNVLAAILIFIVAGAIAAAVGTLVARTMGDTTTGKVVGTVVPILIMAIASFMILNQLKIAPEIVTITYASLLGAIALAMALAFGLGGRDVAARMLEGAYAAGQRNSEQIKRDLQQGREQARQDAERVKARAEEKAEGDELVGVRGSSAGETEEVQFEPSEQLTQQVQPGTPPNSTPPRGTTTR